MTHMVHALEKVRKEILGNIYKHKNLPKGLTIISQNEFEMGILLGHKERL